jgi:hypothetical protein
MANAVEMAQLTGALALIAANGRFQSKGANRPSPRRASHLALIERAIESLSAVSSP